MSSYFWSSQLSQSQLQHRVHKTGINRTWIKGQHPRKPETSRAGPLGLASQLLLPPLGLNGTRTTVLCKAEHFEKQGPSSLYFKTQEMLTPVFPVGGWLLCKLEMAHSFHTLVVRDNIPLGFFQQQFSSSKEPAEKCCRRYSIHPPFRVT